MEITNRQLLPLKLSTNAMTVSNMGTYQWRNKRKEVIKLLKPYCCYCGVKFEKYLKCFRKKPDCDKTNNFILACQLCYMCKHLNSDFIHCCEIYYSNMKQSDINKETTKYLIEYDEYPMPKDIDPNVKKLPVSIVEVIDIFNKYKSKQRPYEMSKYKIFFNKQLSKQYLGDNLNGFAVDCTEENNYQYYFGDKQDDKNNNIPMYKLSDAELKLFTNNNDDTMIMIKEVNIMKQKHKIERTNSKQVKKYIDVLTEKFE